MRRFPEAISNTVAAFSRLPGVGPKTALRYVYYLLRQPKTDLAVMARTLIALSENIFVCEKCHTYSDTVLCEICANARRDATTICVVEESRDIATIESTDIYNGLYHVLGGSLNPIEGLTPDTIRVNELLQRVGSAETQEVILALSPTVQGEMTMLYISKQLAPFNTKITRLARGLPVGATLEFADEVTLSDAIKDRKNC